ncbi:hypothetical protein CDAR_186381 [Caerostris darwini]|uniref:Uncharacterized protein n=1 Tax=Caerostris darwini TaxID=1538125 RepID=A0AAV4V0T1_9ARAC|nr:hypothetical protein CDAR_186381 [Caerostris darwini]
MPLVERKKSNQKNLLEKNQKTFHLPLSSPPPPEKKKENSSKREELSLRGDTPTPSLIPHFHCTHTDDVELLLPLTHLVPTSPKVLRGWKKRGGVLEFHPPLPQPPFRAWVIASTDTKLVSVISFEIGF